MTGYDLPLRAIREQIVSAVDLIVHTARLRDGSRKIVNITEVMGIEDDTILTQDIFVLKQTGFRDGKVEGTLRPTGVWPMFMSAFKANGIELPPGEFGIPPADPTEAVVSRKARLSFGDPRQQGDPQVLSVGLGRSVEVGGADLRLVGRPGRPRDQAGREGWHRGPDPPVHAQPRGRARSCGQLPRQRRLGELVPARPGRLRRVQRGVGALVPGGCAHRPGDRHAPLAPAGGLPHLDRRHRRAGRPHAPASVPMPVALPWAEVARRSQPAAASAPAAGPAATHALTPRRSHPPRARRGDRSCRPRRR